MDRAVPLAVHPHPEYHPLVPGDSTYMASVLLGILYAHLTSKAVLVSKIVDFLNSRKENLKGTSHTQKFIRKIFIMKEF